MRRHRILFLGLIACFAGFCSAPAAQPDEAPQRELSRVETLLANGLDCDPATAGAFASLVRSWKAEDGTPLANAWSSRLEAVRGEEDDEALAKAEAAILGELAGSVTKEFKNKRGRGAVTLDAAIKEKTAQSVTYAQIVYVLAKCAGFDVEPIGVTYPIPGEQPALSGHYACLIRLSDGQSMLVDPAYDPAVSEPFDFEAAYKKADGFFVVADEANALKLHRRIRVLDVDGLRAAAYLGRAEAEFELWHHARTLQYAAKAVELDAASAETYRVRGAAEMDLRQFDAAVADGEKALELNPECAEAWNLIAGARWLAGDVEQAVDDYGRAIEMNPEYASAHINRAQLLHSLGKTSEAERDLKRALEIGPEDLYIRARRAEYLVRAREYEKAVEEHTAVIQLDPDNGAAYADRAYALASLGQREKALSDCAKGLELSPDNATMLVIVGCTFGQLGEDKEAVEYFSRAIEIDPECFRAHHWRGCALLQGSDSVLRRARAIRDLNKAIELNPASSDSCVVRGNYYATHGKPEKALEDLNRAIELSPRSALAYAYRALFLEQEGECEGAIADLDKAIECNANYAWAYFKRGTLRAEMGEDTEAIRDLRKAVDLDPKLAERAQNASNQYDLAADFRIPDDDSDEDEGPDDIPNEEEF
ncbi:MAG: tetratricopeptide repeat protein [Verrucomicrobia bacterium]|nr:tetratricopeptide repeat protein [Verrucomicrobiota bacterium]